MIFAPAIAATIEVLRFFVFPVKKAVPLVAGLGAPGCFYEQKEKRFKGDDKFLIKRTPYGVLFC